MFPLRACRFLRIKFQSSPAQSGHGLLNCASIAPLLSESATTALAVGHDSGVRLPVGILVQLSFVDSTVHA